MKHDLTSFALTEKDLVKMKALPPNHNQLRTAQDLIDAIPHTWRNAEISIANELGYLEPIVRVSLHRNSSGRRVILMQTNDFTKG